MAKLIVMTCLLLACNETKPSTTEKPAQTSPELAKDVVAVPAPPSDPAKADFSALPPDSLKLVIRYQDREIPITKPEFIIGRSKSADLVIDDPKVEPSHAFIAARNGTFYIKDIGSAEGIVFKGARIDHKRVDAGDVFSIAGHEINCRYLP